jgi:Sigma-70, region 4
LQDDPMTLEDLSQHYGISRERVRQIEVRALERLRKSMKTQLAARGIHMPDPKSVLPQAHASDPRRHVEA